MKKMLLSILILCLINSFPGGAFCMDNNTVVLETNQGVIEIKLMPEVAPKACENFKKLALRWHERGALFQVGQ